MFKRILMFAVFTAVLISIPSCVQARTLQDYETEMGVDKIAHAAVGAVCSMYLNERVFKNKKHHKLLAAGTCSFLAFQKEKMDTKSDPKDFLFTSIGIVIPLLEVKVKF